MYISILGFGSTCLGSGKVSPDDFHYEFAPKLQALKDNIDRQLLEHNQAYEKYRKL